MWKNMPSILKSLQNTLRYRENGRLEIDGISVDSVSKKYRTPTLVLSERRFEDNFNSLQDAFVKEHPKTIVAYSVKTNPLSYLLRLVKNRSQSAEVVSQTEIELARKVGFRTQNLIYDGPKSDEDLVFALKSGIYINIDSTEEYISLKNIAEKSKRKVDFGVRLRFTPSGLEKNEVLYDENSPFGLTKEEARKIYLDTLKNRFVKATGVHVHMLNSQVNPKAHGLVTRETVDFVNELYKNGITLDFINIGGGFGSRHLIEENGNSIADFAKTIVKEVRKLPYSPTLIIEPGRYVVSDSLFGVSKVLRKKQSKKKILFTDLGVNVLVPLKSAYFELYPNHLDGKNEIVDVRGPMPFHSDEIRKKVDLHAEEGDLLVATNVGAYTTSLSNNFCGQLKPSIILTQKNRKMKIVQKRQTLVDLQL